MIRALLELLEKHCAKPVETGLHTGKIGLIAPIIRQSYTLGTARESAVREKLANFESKLMKLASRLSIVLESTGSKKTLRGDGFLVVFDPRTTFGGQSSPHHVKIYLERGLARQHFGDRAKPALKQFDARQRKKDGKKQSIKRADAAEMKTFIALVDVQRRR